MNIFVKDRKNKKVGKVEEIKPYEGGVLVYVDFWDEVFIDKHGEGRLGYDKTGSEKQSLLVYLYEDRLDFLRMIPVESIDFKRVLKAWVEERYKRRVKT